MTAPACLPPERDVRSGSPGRRPLVVTDVIEPVEGAEAASTPRVS